MARGVSGCREWGPPAQAGRTMGSLNNESRVHLLPQSPRGLGPLVLVRVRVIRGGREVAWHIVGCLVQRLLASVLQLPATQDLLFSKQQAPMGDMVQAI